MKTAINEDKIILPTKVFLLNSPKSTEKEAKAHINITKKGALSLLWPSAKNSFFILLFIVASG